MALVELRIVKVKVRRSEPYRVEGSTVALLERNPRLLSYESIPYEEKA